MSKRMRLIKESDFNELSKLGSVNPLTETSFIRDNYTANEILDSKTIPDDIKVQLYSSVMSGIGEQLQQILNKPILVKDVTSLNDEDRPEIETDNISSENIDETSTEEGDTNTSFTSTTSAIQLNSIDEDLLQKLPEKCRKKASNIMITLKTNPKIIQWNKYGEVSFLGKEFEPGTSIVDLLSYCVHDLKWAIAPKGTNRFLLSIKNANVPLSLLKNDLRKQMSEEFDDLVAVKSAGTSQLKIDEMKKRFKGWVSIDETEEADFNFSPNSASTPRRE
ncbi:unnamed protein product [Orchesella dallaii]|uniref:Uncharacterized protein n=1 Tax=Orchesella dallaii TaxID=48710 RepID=A0ABP1RRE0_9HEXA